jgi:hypothetical protein
MGEIDTERGEGYKLARHGILLPSVDSKALAEALLQKYSLERLAGDMEVLYEG